MFASCGRIPKPLLDTYIAYQKRMAGSEYVLGIIVSNFINIPTNMQEISSCVRSIRVILALPASRYNPICLPKETPAEIRQALIFELLFLKAIFILNIFLSEMLPISHAT